VILREGRSDLRMGARERHPFRRWLPAHISSLQDAGVPLSAAGATKRPALTCANQIGPPALSRGARRISSQRSASRVSEAASGLSCSTGMYGCVSPNAFGPQTASASGERMMGAALMPSTAIRCPHFSASAVIESTTAIRSGRTGQALKLSARESPNASHRTQHAGRNRSLEALEMHCQAKAGGPSRLRACERGPFRRACCTESDAGVLK